MYTHVRNEQTFLLKEARSMPKTTVREQQTGDQNASQDLMTHILYYSSSVLRPGKGRKRASQGKANDERVKFKAQPHGSVDEDLKRGVSSAAQAQA